MNTIGAGLEFFCGQTHFRRDFFAVSRSGPISIYSKAWYGLTLTIMRSSGLKAIRRRSSTSGSNEPISYGNTKRSAHFGYLNETFVQVRLYGKHVLSIDHQNYTVDQSR